MSEGANAVYIRPSRSAYYRRYPDPVKPRTRYFYVGITDLGPDLQNILRYIIRLSQYYRRSTQFSDLRRAAKISDFS